MRKQLRAVLVRSSSYAFKHDATHSWLSPFPEPRMTLKVNTVTVERVLSVDRTRVDFGQLAVGTKAEVNHPPRACSKP